MEAIDLAFYVTDVDTKIIITTDASVNGFKAVLCQKNDLFHQQKNLSRKKYSSSEKKAIAIIWALHGYTDFYMEENLK